MLPRRRAIQLPRLLSGGGSHPCEIANESGNPPRMAPPKNVLSAGEPRTRETLFADLKTGEAADHDVFTQLGYALRNHVLYRLIRVFYERLFQQGYL